MFTRTFAPLAFIAVLIWLAAVLPSLVAFALGLAP